MRGSTHTVNGTKKVKVISHRQEEKIYYNSNLKKSSRSNKLFAWVRKYANGLMKKFEPIKFEQGEVQKPADVPVSPSYHAVPPPVEALERDDFLMTMSSKDIDLEVCN